MYSNILLLASFFEKKLEKIIKQSVKFKIKIGRYRCMARLPDFKNDSENRFENIIPNVNKRCSRSIYDLGLCKTHLNKLNYGKVDEYPPEEMLFQYRKREINIEEKINLNHTEFSDNVILKKKKKVYLIIKMSFNKIEYEKSFKNLKQINQNFSLDEMYSDIIEKNNLDKKFITVNEKKKIIKNIKQYYNKDHKTLSEYIKDLDINLLNTVRVRDSIFNTAYLYRFNFKECCYLINSNKNVVGNMQNWIDEDDIVPKEYKTADNKVLNPNSNLPIFEITLNSSSKIYCDLLPGVYREYSYNDELEAFMITNNILL